MAKESKDIRGEIRVQIDESAMEASLHFSSDESGESWDREKLTLRLKQEEILGRVDPDNITQALKAFGDGKGDASFVVAKGTPAEVTQHEEILWEKFEVPAELDAVADSIFKSAEEPIVYDIQSEKVKVEETVEKKAKLPFLKARQEKVTKWKKQEVRRGVAVHPYIVDRGYLNEGDLIATVEFGKIGKPGVDLYGKPVSPEKPIKAPLYLGTGVVRRGFEVRSEIDGFLRRGEDWVDIIPYALHRIKVYASEDKNTCLLDFSPGSGGPPSVQDILKKAEALGFNPADLIGLRDIEFLIKGARKESRPLEAEPLSKSQDAGFNLEVSSDKLRATLSLKKGRGRCKPLSLKELGKAVSDAHFRGLDVQKVKNDILQFLKGSETDEAAQKRPI